MYFNYHAKAKNLIRQGQLTKVVITKKYNSISPAMVLFFSNSKPMPIREYRWQEYIQFFKTEKVNVKVQNNLTKDNIIKI